MALPPQSLAVIRWNRLVLLDAWDVPQLLALLREPGGPEAVTDQSRLERIAQVLVAWGDSMRLSVGKGCFGMLGFNLLFLVSLVYSLRVCLELVTNAFRFLMKGTFSDSDE